MSTPGDEELWQPARTFKAHDSEEGWHLTPEQIELAPKLVIRIRESEPFDDDYIMEGRAIKHCNSKRFFQIHPEDCARLGFPDDTLYLCEHEILTD
jgi:hypothetical protein